MELRKGIEEADLSFNQVAKQANLSPHTIKKLYDYDYDGIPSSLVAAKLEELMHKNLWWRQKMAEISPEAGRHNPSHAPPKTHRATYITWIDPPKRRPRRRLMPN